MKKKILLRGLLGFPTGITISYLITILLSLIWADGYYSPCVPGLAAAMGNEINAVMVQALLSGLLGAGFGAASMIWKMEEWSIVKQTGIYFGTISVIMMPVAWFTYWMQHTLRGFLCYFGLFALIFALIWVIQFMTGRHTVKKLNENLRKNREK